VAVVSSAIAIGNAVLATVGISTSSIALIAGVGFATQTALGLALNALTPKPKIGRRERGYNVNQRQPALDHQIVYGRARVGGAIVFQGTTGNNNKFLHQIVAYTGHEIEEFEEIYINDAKVTNLEADGNVKEIELPDGTTSNRYDGKLRIKKHLGESDQAADSDLVNEVPKWTNEHRLRGIAYLYCRFKFDQDTYPNGVPQVTTTIKGKKVYDPRTDTVAWSDNPALCLRDYIRSDYGLSESAANIDDTLVQEAANVCDETALNGEKRYTCNGNFTTELAPYDALNDLLTSMGGLLWYAQGEWRMKPAYWTAPEITLTEDDLRSEISVQTRHSRRDNFNTVKGTFRGDETDWQTADFPEVTNQAFLNADNGQESVIDLELPFTDNSDEARRIGRIALERNRQQLTVQASWGLRAFQLQVGSIVNLSIDRFGWDQKTFEVSSWTFGLTDAQDLQVQMTLREISENVFDEVDDGVIYERDNTELLSPFDVPFVGLNAVTTTKIIREKLTNVATVTVSSGRPEGVDRVELQFKKSSDTQWKSGGTGELGQFDIVDLDDSLYSFRARAINSFGNKGEWEYLVGISASGLTEPPSDVEGFVAEVSGGILNLEWDAIPDFDLSYYRIRFSPDIGNGTWANSVDYVNKVPRPATNVPASARPGDYLIRAYDKTGIASQNYTTVSVPEADLESYTNTLTQAEAPSFSGTKTNLAVTTGDELRLDSYSSGPSTGTYEFSNYIDTGAVRRCRVYVDAINARFDNTAGLFDDQPGFFDAAPGLFDDLGGDSQFADTTVTVYVSTTDDDPSGIPTWSDWKVIRAADLSARAFRFKCDLVSTSDNVTPSVSTLTAYVKHN